MYIFYRKLHINLCNIMWRNVVIEGYVALYAAIFEWISCHVNLLGQRQVWNNYESHNIWKPYDLFLYSAFHSNAASKCSTWSLLWSLGPGMHSSTQEGIWQSSESTRLYSWFLTGPQSHIYLGGIKMKLPFCSIDHYLKFFGLWPT